MLDRKKKIMLIVFAVALCTAAASFAAVTYGVKNTVHNIGSTSIGSTKTVETSEICLFCHIPHNANTSGGKKFLWSRNEPTTGSFALYTGSPTLNFNKATYGTLSEISKMCMSCHDGATAMNSMANPKGITFDVRIGQAWPDPFDPTNFGPNIGEYNIETSTGGGNLTNDHPVSFSYADSRTGDPTGIKAPDGGGNSVGGLPLWEGKVECVTCHDPHIDYGDSNGTRLAGGANATGDPALTPFLRKSNSSSSLCFTCHDK